MISDVLSEAGEHIRRYLRDFPETYEEVDKELNELLKAMDKIRMELDRPPSPQELEQFMDAGMKVDSPVTRPE